METLTERQAMLIEDALADRLLPKAEEMTYND